MKLTVELVKNREAVLEKWFDAIIATYPPETSNFLTRQKDRFRNPVGYAIEHSIGSVYDQIAGTMNCEELLDSLDGVIRIRSVQEFTPSEAISWVFQLKSIVREVLGARVGELVHSGDLAELDRRIDRAAMLAFEKYVECREKLFEIRAGEIRRQSLRLMERYTSNPCEPRKGENHNTTCFDPAAEKGGCDR